MWFVLFVCVLFKLCEVFVLFCVCVHGMCVCLFVCVRFTVPCEMVCLFSVFV
jgi:hypothetical protein